MKPLPDTMEEVTIYPKCGKAYSFRKYKDTPEGWDAFFEEVYYPLCADIHRTLHEKKTQEEVA